MATVRIGFEDWEIPAQADIEAAHKTRLGYVLLNAKRTHGSKECVVYPAYLGAIEDGVTDDGEAITAACEVAETFSLPVCLGGVVLPAPVSHTVAAAVSIPCSGSVLLLTVTGAKDMSAHPNVADGVRVGQTVKLVNLGADAVTLHDEGDDAGANLQLAAATLVLSLNDSVELLWDGDQWLAIDQENVA